MRLGPIDHKVTVAAIVEVEGRVSFAPRHQQRLLTTHAHTRLLARTRRCLAMELLCEESQANTEIKSNQNRLEKV